MRSEKLNLIPENARKQPIFVIECAQNVLFVPKNVQFACNSARKNARRANNAQGGRLTCQSDARSPREALSRLFTNRCGKLDKEKQNTHKAAFRRSGGRCFLLHDGAINPEVGNFARHFFGTDGAGSNFGNESGIEREAQKLVAAGWIHGPVINGPASIKAVVQD